MTRPACAAALAATPAGGALGWDAPEAVADPRPMTRPACAAALAATPAGGALGGDAPEAAAAPAPDTMSGTMSAPASSPRTGAMIRAVLLAALAAHAAAPAGAQGAAAPGASAGAPALAAAPGAVLRWLDKVSGQTLDLTIDRAAPVGLGRLSIAMTDCRYPAADPAANAFAHLTIRDALQPSAPVFDGWMVADSPALSAMDHPRYDVWLLRCISS